MKLSPRSYSIFWDAHAWVGAIASLILFTVFFLGAFALFAEELGPWQEPRFRAPIEASDEQSLAIAQRIVDGEAAARPAWLGISLPSPDEPWLRIWRLRGGDSLTYEFIHPLTGERFDQRSNLGEFLNEMHFLAPLPYGLELAGVASLVLIFLAGTGLLLQLGKIARELMQFRPHASQRRVLWSDAHKVVGVISLPFFLLFGLSGAALTLGDSLRPALVAHLFDGDAEAMADVTEWPQIAAPSGVAAAAPDLAAAYHSATRLHPDAEHRWFFVANLGDERAVVDLPGEQEGRIAPFTNVRLDRDGAVIWSREPGGKNLYASAAATLYGLHFGGFAGLWGKALYAVLALLAAFGILSGNLLWIDRRLDKGLGRFDRFLAELTAGGCAGLPFAVAVMFLANQLLAPALPGRVGAEQVAFFSAWGAALIYAFLLRRAGDAARQLLFCGGGLLLLLPLLDAFRTGRVPFAPNPAWLFATETALALLGGLLLAFAWGMGRMQARRTLSPRGPLAHEGSLGPRPERSS